MVAPCPNCSSRPGESRRQSHSNNNETLACAPQSREGIAREECSRDSAARAPRYAESQSRARWRGWPSRAFLRGPVLEEAQKEKRAT
ncbi:hypothetical protein EBS02_07355, partial [bacterium]|nr:hypothetical protein [bacterium]